MTAPAPPSYVGYRFPAEIISHAVWLYFRFPLSLRHVNEILAARGIDVSHETVRQWGLKFGQAFANQIRRRLPQVGDKWHLDEGVLRTYDQQWECGAASRTTTWFGFGPKSLAGRAHAQLAAGEQAPWPALRPVRLRHSITA